MDCSQKFVDAVKSILLTKCHERKQEWDKLKYEGKLTPSLSLF